MKANFNFRIKKILTQRRRERKDTQSFLENFIQKVLALLNIAISSFFNFSGKKILIPINRDRDRKGTSDCHPPSAEGVGRQSFLENFHQKVLCVLCASAFVNIFSFLVLPVPLGPVPSGACPVQVLI